MLFYLACFGNQQKQVRSKKKFSGWGQSPKLFVPNSVRSFFSTKLKIPTLFGVGYTLNVTIKIYRGNLDLRQSEISKHNFYALVVLSLVFYAFWIFLV